MKHPTLVKPPNPHREAIVRAWHGELSARELGQEFNLPRASICRIWHTAKKRGELPARKRGA